MLLQQFFISSIHFASFLLPLSQLSAIKFKISKYFSCTIVNKICKSFFGFYLHFTQWNKFFWNQGCGYDLYLTTDVLYADKYIWNNYPSLFVFGPNPFNQSQADSFNKELNITNISLYARKIQRPDKLVLLSNTETTAQVQRENEHSANWTFFRASALNWKSLQLYPLRE